MSGICGIVHLDGAPADRQALRAMAAAMAFRGPDRLDLRVEGSAAFAHALLRTDPEAPEECQPLTLEGRTWLVADVRLDAREELRGALLAHGRTVPDHCGDAALVLHAWHAWGEACAERLLGDFAFAVWDAPARRLFCARDRMGVKSLFYARIGDCVVFANGIGCLRSHRAVPGTLDDLAIADFLLFERGEDPAATGFAAIRRVPASATVAFHPGGTRASTYWEPPRESAPRYRRAGDYAERLRELLQQAVADRLRTRQAAVQMSGGLDSTLLAALARREFVGRRQPFDLRAHTIGYESLLPDKDLPYAVLAGRALDIPVVFHPGDGHALYEGFERYQARFPEPFHGPDLAVGYDCLAAAAGGARVLLTGYDGDALLNESPKPYLRWLLRKGRFVSCATSVVRYAISQRRFWPRRRARVAEGASFPDWIDEGLAQRLDLRERWRRHRDDATDPHPYRPHAYACLAEIRRYGALFDQYDPGVTGLALECRHPFMDARVIEFCLGLPPEPWCVQKTAERRAAAGLLPDAIRLRPKAGMAGFAGEYLMKRPESAWVDGFDPAPQLDRYVKRRRIPKVSGAARPPLEAWRDLRPLSLNYWLLALERPQIASEELHHELAR